jgi:hypothetical protein
VLDEGRAGPIDHVEHEIESIRTSVIGIRYIEVAVLMGVELPEEGDQCACLPLRLQMAKVMKIGAIHREDVVELVEVLETHTASETPECNPVACGDLQRARVGGFALVPRPSTCGVHADPVREIFFL